MKKSAKKSVRKAKGRSVVKNQLLLGELAFIINRAPICIKVFDKSGRMRYINETGAEEHFLKSPEEIERWDYLSSVAPEFVAPVSKSMKAALKGEASVIEFRHEAGTSTNEWCSGHLIPLKDNQGQNIGVLFSSIDATERRNLAEKITKLEEAKEEFVSVAAHQLRSPITVLNGYSALLLGDQSEFSQDHREIITAISQTSKNMNDLVDFILKIVRSEKGSSNLTLAPLDLVEITREVVGLLQHELDEKSQRVDIKNLPTSFPTVLTNREAAFQVIQNLISNASRYSPSKSAIAISLSLQNGQAQWSIQDRGIGIPHDEQPKIFEKFYRANNAKHTVPYGTGLGLSLAKSLVEAWGGKIRFDSEENKGTLFSITLPLE